MCSEESDVDIVLRVDSHGFAGPGNDTIKFLAQLQWGSENRTFENRNHSKTGRFEGRSDHSKTGKNGPVFECLAKTGHFRPVFEWFCIRKLDKWSGFQMPFDNRTIYNPTLF